MESINKNDVTTDYRNMEPDKFAEKYPYVKVEEIRKERNWYEEAKDKGMVVGEDMICPVTKQHCDDECCLVGAVCNLSGNAGECPTDAPTPLQPPKTSGGYTAEDIERIRKEGINADQEDKSPYEDYIDAIASNRIISEYEAQNPPSLLQDIWMGSIGPEKYPDGIYNSLEEILEDMRQQKRHLTIMSKIQNTINSGAYIQTDGKE